MMLNSADHIITITMSEEQWRKADTALPDIAGMITDAANLFELLGSTMADGRVAGDEPGLSSLMNICAKAFKSASENEGATLRLIEGEIRKRVSKK